MYPKNNGEQLVWLCHVHRSEGDGGGDYCVVPCEFLVVRSSVVVMDTVGRGGSAED